MSLSPFERNGSIYEEDERFYDYKANPCRIQMF